MFNSIRKDLRHIFSLLRPERQQYAYGILALFVLNIADVIAPLFLAVAIDHTEALLTQKLSPPPPLFTWIGLKSQHFSMNSALILFLSCHLISNLCRYPMLMCIAVPSQRIGQRLRNALVDTFLRLPSVFYDKAKSGDLMSRATTDVHATRMMLGPGVLIGIDTIFIVLMVIMVLFSLSWKLTLIALLPLPVIGFVTNKLSHAVYNRFEKVQAETARLTERARESYAGIRMIQAYAREEYDVQRFTTASWILYLKNLNLVKVKAIFEPTLSLMIGISSSLIVIFGGVEVLRGTITLGSFMAFLFLVTYLSGPMIGFGWSVSLFQRGRASLHRIDQILNDPVQIHDKGHEEELENLGTLELRNLSFTYERVSEQQTKQEMSLEEPPAEESPAEESPAEGSPAEGPPAEESPAEGPLTALQNISLNLPKGSLLGVIGPVGSGKSTLVRLLTRLYEPPDGTIFLDGVDVNNCSLRSLREHIVLAPQDTFLFSDTVARNISLGKQVTQEEIERVTELACLHDEILELSEGYNTILGERGVNLSGGQRQRLAIARAIATDPPVLLLDDCLSAVDSKTEEAILENLRVIFKDRTGVIISHRVCAVQSCDHIVVLQGGQIQEQGTHDELMSNNGYYTDIALEQSEIGG